MEKHNSSILEMIYNSVKKSPDSKALVFKDRIFTYRQLEELSGKITSILNSMGIGRGDIVPVLVPRSEYMLLCTLGVLRTGAAYQPLDISHPVERIHFMINDAHARVVLTSKKYKDIFANLVNPLNPVTPINPLNPATSMSPMDPMNPMSPMSSIKLLFIEDIGNTIEEKPCALRSNAEIWNMPEISDLFVILYTSGSTGVPKGIMLEHGNILSYCKWYLDYYDVNESCIMAEHPSFVFDMSIGELLLPLAGGASVYIIPEEIRTDIYELNKYFESKQITHATMTTQLGRQFAMNVENHSLRNLMVIGEALSSVKPPSGYTLINAYGPAECTLAVTFHEVDREYPEKVPIGKAMPEVEIYILDKEGKLCPEGETGELCVTGPHVGRGYLNQEELTAKAFTTNPFSDKEGYKRLYHTGDLARWAEDGLLEYMGRANRQIKIRGFRIEPQEIEAVIRSFEGIRDVRVSAFEINGGKYLSAYYLSDIAIDHKALSNFILEKKPSYMLPSFFIRLDEFPLNTNGKVDYSSLPKPDFNQNRESYEEPVSETEKRLAKIFERTLKVSDVGRSDDFFRLGGHSLLAANLAHELSDEFGIGISAVDIMGNPAILNLAAKIDEALSLSRNQHSIIQIEGFQQLKQEKEKDRESGENREDREGEKSKGSSGDGEYRKKRNNIKVGLEEKSSGNHIIIPASTAQRRIFAADEIAREEFADFNTSFVPLTQGNPESAYLLPLSLYVKGTLEIERIKDVLTEMFMSHESLRTCFFLSDSNLMNKIYPVNREWARDAVSRSECTEDCTKGMEDTTAWSISPTDEAPLFRWRYISIETNPESRLDFCFHHLISDGRSEILFLQEFISLYNANYGNYSSHSSYGNSFENESAVGETPTSSDIGSIRSIRSKIPGAIRAHYRDFIAWEIKFLGSEEAAKLREDWRKLLSDFDKIQEPTLTPLPSTASLLSPATLHSLDSLSSLNVLPSSNSPTLSEAEAERSCHEIIKLDNYASNEVDIFCREAGVSPYMLLLSVFSILIKRYSGLNEFFLGTVMDGRLRREYENSQGMFVNTVPLPISFNVFNEKKDSSLSFKEFLSRIKELTVYAYSHQIIPLEEIAGIWEGLNNSNRKRTSHGHLLFDFLFVMQNFDRELPDINTYPSSLEFAPSKTPMYDLTLEAERLNEGYTFDFEYDTKLFPDKKWISLFAEHYKNLLLSCVTMSKTDADIPLSKLSMLGKAERNLLLRDFQGKALPIREKHATIVDRLREQCRKNGENTAVIFGDDEMSYNCLSEQSERLAFILSSVVSAEPKDTDSNDPKVIEPNVIKPKAVDPKVTDPKVIIIARRGFEMLLSIWGIIKSGAAYVPVSPDYPDERIRLIIEDCNPFCVISCDKNLTGRMKNILSKIMPQNGIWLLSVSYNAKNNNARFVWEISNIKSGSGIKDNDTGIFTGVEAGIDKATETGLAYIIYTSGTTGIPNGVMVEHRQLSNMLSAYDEIYGLNEKDCVLQFANFVFDQSVWEFFQILTAGGRLLLIPDEMVRDPEALADYCAKWNVTMLMLTPGMLRTMNPEDFPGIRILDVGGEAPDRELLSKWYKEGRKIFNTYGPTETTVNASSFLFKPYNPCNPFNSFDPCNSFNSNNHFVQEDVLPIGKPIANTRMYVLNGTELCGIGIKGELCIAGEGVARGYLNRPELSSIRFTTDPFLRGRMYRTGDLALILPDGNIVFSGRIDEQVKIRGYRIEPDEIARRIKELPFIKDVVVLAAKDPAGDMKLRAYYVPYSQYIHTPNKPYTPYMPYTSIQGNGNNEVQNRKIREHLSMILPEYMIPSVFIMMPSLPMTINGKLDKKMLPEPSLENRENSYKNYNNSQNYEEYTEYEKYENHENHGNSGNYDNYENNTEREIARVFSKVLGLKNINANADFLAMGGDSIKAILIVSRLRELGYKLNNAMVLRSGTVRNLSRQIGNKDDGYSYNHNQYDQSNAYKPGGPDNPYSSEITYNSDNPYSSDNNSEYPKEWEYVRPTPVMLSFLNAEMPYPDYYNQSRFFEIKGETNIKVLAWSLGELIRRHGMFRAVLEERSLPKSQTSSGTSLKIDTVEGAFLSMDQAENLDRHQLKSVNQGNKDTESTFVEKNNSSNSECLQFIIKDNSDLPPFPLSVYPYMPESQRLSCLNALQKSLSPKKGIMLRAALFEERKSDLLFIVCHHFVIDEVSWNIIQEDLMRLYIEGCKNPALLYMTDTEKDRAIPIRQSSSFGEWSHKLWEYRDSSLFIPEKLYWQEIDKKLEEGSEALDMFLASDEKRALHAFPVITLNVANDTAKGILNLSEQKYRSRPDSLLLAALIHALKSYINNNSNNNDDDRNKNNKNSLSSIRIFMESHGRGQVATEVQIDRTIGWFTSIYPIILTYFEDYDKQITEIRDLLLSVPNEGIGWGLLNAGSAKETGIVFNYLGRSDTSSNYEDDVISLCELETGRDVHPDNGEKGTITFNIRFTSDGLFIECCYDSIFDEAKVRSLLRKFDKELGNIALYSPHSLCVGEIMPSDDWKFLGQHISLDKVQALSPLTPLQQGMLYRWMSAPNSRQYVLYDKIKLFSKWDRDSFIAALNLVVERHEALRTSFVYEGLKQPWQIIWKEMKADFKELSIANASQAWLCHEQKSGNETFTVKLEHQFDLRHGPLLKVRTVHSANNTEIEICTHHIIMDGWSFSIFLNDLMGYYEELISGVSERELRKKVLKDREQSICLSDWLRIRMKHRTPNELLLNERSKYDDDFYSDALSFWRNYLDGCSAGSGIRTVPHNLSGDMPFYKGEYYKPVSSLILDEGLSNSIKTYGISTRVTPGAFFSALWGILLCKENGCFDVVFGETVSGRSLQEGIDSQDRIDGQKGIHDQEGIDGLIGMLINTIPVRVQGDSSTLVSEIMRTRQEDYFITEPYESSSLSEISSHLGYGGILVSTLYVFENYPGEDINTSHKTFTIEESREETDFDIVFFVEYYNDKSFKLNIQFNGDLFPPKYIELILKRVENLARQIVSDSGYGISLGELDPITEYEKKLMLGQISGISKHYPKQTVLDMLINNARSFPDRTALRMNESTLTYKELLNLAKKLAKTIGLGGERFIALFMDRGFEMIVSMYAVMIAGAAYIPLDPGYPEKRLRYILEDAHPEAILLDSGCQGKDEALCRIASERSIRLIMVDKIGEASSDKTSLNRNGAFTVSVPEAETLWDRLCYMIYTSGTTGAPKGVMIDHKGLSEMVYSNTDLYGSFDRDTVPQLANYVFDTSAWEIYNTLGSGGTLVLVPNETLKTAEGIENYCIKMNVSKMVITNALLKALHPEHFNTLSLLTTGGDSAYSHTYKEWEGKAKRIVNTYGPTEITVNATFHSYESGENDPIPIGRPLPNRKFYIMQGDKLCGTGQQGEICIGGAGIARGYLNKEEITKRVFVKNPFDHGQMYRTGDLGAFMPDGSLIFLGRNDSQVKIRGLRIELGEIETCLEEYEGIQEAAALCRSSLPIQNNFGKDEPSSLSGINQSKNSSGQDYIVAYIVGDKKIDTGDVKKFLEAMLPSYMIPTFMIQLDRLPTNLSGKLDIKKLPKPEIEIHEDKAVVAPANSYEKKIVDIYEDILGIKGVSRNDSFFRLGASSIDVMKLCSALYEYGVKIQDVFTNPSPKSLGSLLLKNDLRSTTDGFFLMKDNIMKDNITSGKAPSIFCLPPSGGMTMCYLDLINDLNHPGKVYGITDLKYHLLENLSLDELNEVAVSVLSQDDKKPIPIASQEECIQYYFDKIIDIFSEQDIIIGYSQGGAAAHILAKKLEEAGKNPGAVIMLESEPHSEEADEQQWPVDELNMSENENVAGQKLTLSEKQRLVEEVLMVFSGSKVGQLSSVRPDFQNESLYEYFDRWLEENKNNLNIIEKGGNGEKETILRMLLETCIVYSYNVTHPLNLSAFSAPSAFSTGKAAARPQGAGYINPSKPGSSNEHSPKATIIEPEKINAPIYSILLKYNQKSPMNRSALALIDFKNSGALNKNTIDHFVFLSKYKEEIKAILEKLLHDLGR